MAEGTWTVQAVPLTQTVRLDARTANWLRHEYDMMRAREPARTDGRRKGRRRRGWRRFPSRRGRRVSLSRFFELCHAELEASARRWQAYFDGIYEEAMRQAGVTRG